MLNNILKVYGEDLAAGALNQASIAAGTGIAAGSTQGALCVNALAVGDVCCRGLYRVHHRDAFNAGNKLFAHLCIELKIAIERLFWKPNRDLGRTW